MRSILNTLALILLLTQVVKGQSEVAFELKKEQNIDNEILISSHNVEEIDSWTDLLNMSHLPMIRNIDIKTKEDIIDFSFFF